MFKAAPEAIGNFARWVPGRQCVFWPLTTIADLQLDYGIKCFNVPQLQKRSRRPEPRDAVLASKQERSKRCQKRLCGRMTRQIEQIDTLLPLSIGACTVLCTILIHALALGATVNFFRLEKKRGHPGAGAFVDLAIAVLAISFAFAAHLLAIGLWAVLFVTLGEFQELGTAYYHSAVNYTSLGYGDLLLNSIVEIAWSFGSRKRSADVRCFHRDGVCRRPTTDSGSI